MKKISRPAPATGNTNQNNYGYQASPSRTANSSFSMDVDSPRPAAASRVYYESTAVPAQYPHKLSLYTQIPGYEISIEEFEELALARLERTKPSKNKKNALITF